jgi:hypothetical protein
MVSYMPLPFLFIIYKLFLRILSPILKHIKYPSTSPLLSPCLWLVHPCLRPRHSRYYFSSSWIALPLLKPLSPCLPPFHRRAFIDLHSTIPPRPTATQEEGIGSHHRECHPRSHKCYHLGILALPLVRKCRSHLLLGLSGLST